MNKPFLVKVVGEFEIKETASLATIQQVLAEVQTLLQQRLGPGALVLKVGRQEYTV